MEVETIFTCPLGSTCKKVVDDKIHQCIWLIPLEGDNPQTGERMTTERCSIAWQPLLMIEQSGQVRATAASVQSLRNETVKRQDEAIKVITDDKASKNI